MYLPKIFYGEQISKKGDLEGRKVLLIQNMSKGCYKFAPWLPSSCFFHSFILFQQFFGLLANFATIWISKNILH
jgi:hypothetical protein